MKLVTFLSNGACKIGALVGDAIVAADDSLPNDMIGFLAAGVEARRALQALIDGGAPRRALADVTLLAPIPRPGKLLGIGLNYADHINETGWEKPEYPTFSPNKALVSLAPTPRSISRQYRTRSITKANWPS